MANYNVFKFISAITYFISSVSIDSSWSTRIMRRVRANHSEAFEALLQILDTIQQLALSVSELRTEHTHAFIEEESLSDNVPEVSDNTVM